MRQKKTRNTQRQLRIIGGQWRGRKFSFPDHPGIRPTPDRVRETLFNWLQHAVHGARCLDLFSGSGALGLEALSRGAKTVDFVEQDHASASAIRNHLETLQATENETVQITDALQFLSHKPEKPYDLIFLDPPFSVGLLETVLTQLCTGYFLTNETLIYLEAEKELSLDFLHADESRKSSDQEEQSVAPNTPPNCNWQILKQKEAGQVQFLLVQLRSQ